MHINQFRPLPFLHELVTPGPPQRHQFVKRRTKTLVRRQGKPDSASDPEPSADADGVLGVGRNRTTIFYRHFSIPTPQRHNRHEPPKQPSNRRQRTLRMWENVASCAEYPAAPRQVATMQARGSARQATRSTISEGDGMARRWTPQRTVILRRIRVACCSIAVVLASVCTFTVGARKTVALSINGQTTTITTYASSVDRLLSERGITIKSHDIIESTSKGALKDHDVVTIRSAYETTINIDGTEVPFWTVATSMDQLLGFFEQNEQAASKVTVDIKNVYNQLTGGLVINEAGPVTVIADGTTSIAPNGKLTAASILDSKGITLGKEDRVSVERDNGTTILRVQRVKHQTETRTETIPFDTQTVVDNSLQPGQTVIQQAGQNGAKVDTYDVTYVDGAKESETLTSSQTTAVPVMQIIAVGPEQSSDSADSGSSDSGSAAAGGSNSSDSGDSDSGSGSSDSSSSSSGSSSPSASASPKPAPSKTATASPSPSKPTTTPKPSPSQNATSKPSPSPSSTASTGGSSSGSSSGSGSSSAAGSRLWHPTVQQAQTYAAGAAAQRGWTGDEWTSLVNLWTKESGWRWSAGNPTSGAYGIPQSLPGSKMAQFGANWKDDGAVQIDWGLYYITIRYGKPSVAWQHWKDFNWY